jgi:phosphonoacetaldehyde hydrolase
MTPHIGGRFSGKVKAVVLDWAGTAVDFGCMGPVAPFIEIFARRGVSITTEEARKPMGLMKKDHIRAMLQSWEVCAEWFDVFGREPAEDDVNEMYLELEPLMVSTVSRFSDPIPGLLETIREFRNLGLKIGSTTGYTQPIMDVLVPGARRKGYAPDSVVTSSEVPEGRPSPFMIYKNALNLAVHPLEAIVKIGDTVTDIEEGLNAGTWCIGVTRSSSSLGLTESEVSSLPAGELEKRLNVISARYLEAGAHYVAESIADCPRIISEINQRLASGERP